MPSSKERTSSLRLKRISEGPKTHGTHSSYVNYNCRCSKCTKAESDYALSRSKSPNKGTRKDLGTGWNRSREDGKVIQKKDLHGTRARYLLGCRCDFCNRAQKGYNLRREYGITVEDYENMLVAQIGLCDICKKPPSSEGLHVDHNHSTNKARSLLCGNCNRGIGQLLDDPWIMRQAADYIERHKGEVWE